MPSPAQVDDDDVVVLLGDEGGNHPEPTTGTLWWGAGPTPTVDFLDEKKRVFESMGEVKDVIMFLAVSNGCPFVVFQSGPTRYEVGCVSNRGKNESDPSRCSFDIRARPQKKLDGKVVVHHSNLYHSCGCMLTKRARVRGAGAKFVSRQIVQN